MATDPVLVYLHGVGGVRPGWAEHLLVDQQIEHRIDRVRIVAPSYTSILSAEFDDAEFDVEGYEGDVEGYEVDAECTARYRTRQRELAARVAECSDVVPAGLAWPSLLPRPGRCCGSVLAVVAAPTRTVADRRVPRFTGTVHRRLGSSASLCP